ncbi:3',5'-cyclic-nucleotide phosphodiesterase [Strigomonas culicis]|nr:3',5'-cyclic-nucleotide phosphodiesterase [Strigomonas culicis]|eukprot:EPY19529.1 3',5'-cyclic-nucleotide phosphodiesterase [Strigomonas culicis]
MSVIHKVVKPFTVLEMQDMRDRYILDPLYGTILMALDKIDDWDFNVFSVQAALNGDDHASLPFQEKGGALFVTFYALFWKYDLFKKFNIDEQVALNWVSAVEAGYHGNPYHNSMHAADVLHVTHYILSKGGLIERCQLSDKMILSALFSAAIHDFDHPGINNNFHIKTRSHLATLYNDRSVLENLHVSSVFELIKNPAFNILASLSEDQWREVREVVVEMVLATDMGLHGKYVAMMKTRLQERADFLQKDDKILALAMALKMADISNCGRPQEIYLRWSGKISDEFYQQGDRERNLGLACSPFMDRTQPAIAKGQISFMNYIVIPFFEQISELLPNMRVSVDCAEGNKTYWAQNDDS